MNFSKNSTLLLWASVFCLFCCSCSLINKPAEPVSNPVIPQQEPLVAPDDLTAPGIEASSGKSEDPVIPYDVVHYVQWEGETLSIIARWYTGALKNWKALEMANPEINPHILHLNTKIRIPQALIKNQNPMPKEFIDQFYQKEKPPVPKVPEPVEDDDDIQLFGPRTFQPE